MEPWGRVDGDALAAYLAPRAPHATRPWVVANMVAGLDGCAARGGRVGGLSGAADQELFRRLRQVADVVLVGARTVRLERYGPVRLTDDEQAVRTERGQQPLPRMAIVSGSLDFDWTIPLFGDSATGPGAPVFLTSAAADPAAIAAAEQHGEVLVAGDASVDLVAALTSLHASGTGTVLTEGGPHLLGELAAKGLLDELCLTLSPVMGGDPLPVAVWPPNTAPWDFRLASVATEDGHLFLRYLQEPQP
ncbi:pyrimidine reductase family protein [Aquihabitans daechungensis]|uniref:pyrimidine reductase family protein n=1 Tax=Aquihabitans daechungensis TaxID=1052257 RepID=UPI003BA2EC8E